MRQLLERTKEDQEIKVDALNDIYYKGKDQEAEFEPLFLSLREQTLSLIETRNLYNDQLTTITDEMKRAINYIEEKANALETKMGKEY